MGLATASDLPVATICMPLGDACYACCYYKELCGHFSADEAERKLSLVCVLAGQFHGGG